MTDKIKRDIRLIVKTEQHSGFGDPYLTVEVGVCYVGEDGKILNPMFGHGWDQPAGVPDLDSLAVTAQANTSDESAWYGWSLEYRQPYRVQLDYAEAMVRTLRRLAKRMDALSERMGRPETLADYLIRLSMALGTTARAPFGEHNGASPRSDGNWVWHDADSIRYYLARALEDFRKPHTANAA